MRTSSESDSYQHELVALYDDSNMSLELHSLNPQPDHFRSPKSYIDTCRPWTDHSKHVEMLSLGNTKLFVLGISYVDNNFNELYLYGLRHNKNKKSPSTETAYSLAPKLRCIERSRDYTVQHEMSQFAFNEKRGFLAGAAHCREGIAYHLWKPTEQALHLVRKSSYDRQLTLMWPRIGYSHHYDISSLDFSSNGELIAILSMNMCVLIKDVNYNRTIADIRSTHCDKTTVNNTCRWNSDSSQIFLLYGGYSNFLSIVDSETIKVAAKISQPSFKLSTMELSRVNPNLIVCGLADSRASFVVYDSRVSFYFPVHRLNYSDPMGRLDLNSDSTYQKRRETASFKWSAANEFQILCKAASKFGVVDLRTMQGIDIANNHVGYTNFCSLGVL